ncbi:MAG: hypothetical protein CMJ58_18800 [Planctomycetaceae bacterium]|nr:hypothetical protein [Planctomycetaceae bacterium]
MSQGIPAEFSIPNAVEAYCEHCKGVHPFNPKDIHGETLERELMAGLFTLKCRRCCKSYIVIAVMAEYVQGIYWRLTKAGQTPPPGPPLPARLLRLLTGHSELLKQARRAENAGLGIGAYAYYRRVVEVERDVLFGEVIKYAESKPGQDDVVQAFTDAKQERQFTKSFDMVKDHLPDQLKINGENPFTLLHAAMSDAVHNWTDEKCLKVAGSIRTVLTAFAETLANVRKSEDLIKNAIKDLREAGDD